MTISFIIPAYQCETFLAQTVRDILKTQMPIEEILLIDDGSTDGTGALCDALSAQYAPVRCIHKRNGGVSSARNLGIEQARGDYIWFVDSDDSVFSIPDSELAACEKTRPGMVLFGMQFDYYRGDRLMQTQRLQMPERMELMSEQFGKQFRLLFFRNYLSPVWNKLFRRSLLLEHQLRFDPSLTNYEDLAFSLAVMSVCDRVLVLPDVSYDYKTDYDHDRTVDRIGRINNVAANTDLIARQFFKLRDCCRFDENAAAQLEQIVLQIYLDLFLVKLQTTPLPGVKKQCEDFLSSRCFLQCEKHASALPKSGQKLLRRIHKKMGLSIWIRVRYRVFRNRTVRLIKPILKKGQQ